ncbi:MAG TPA: xanthine dehydrogenase family protein molybdopterin-binding subunit [Rudaea sp.]|jgi:xanthine dehydrogenase YagR molybdenum-binding subunit|nr:xanthine dehydrogenase family protein molybdopterin-binding subunit [Rudaea sp.]
MTSVVGQPITRIDGAAKVTGKAQYAADFDVSKIAYAWLIQSTIAKGKIAAIDTRRASAAPGVLLVMTYQNAPKLSASAQQADPPGERALSLLQDATVRYNGEPVAVVVAESLEQARRGAELVEISYAAESPVLNFDAAQSSSYTPEKITHGKPDVAWGDADGALASAAVKMIATYTTPMENHNPMEPHATLAVWEGDRLTVYDSTQGVSGTKTAVAKKLGIEPDKVKVISPYVGGGFGCKGSAWSHVVLAAMAARQTHRPVRLALERTQMFGPVGYRPHTLQHIALATDRDGKLTAIKHDVTSSTSTFEDWVESSAVVTRMLYACPNVSTTHRLVKLNLGTPTFMRAPGESTGTYAIEAAMDELAYALKLDPLELRLRNYADKDPETGLPFSSKSLKQCYASAADRFGWSKRSHEPRSMRDGGKLLGWGMATATYPANRMPAKALVRVMPDGSALVQCGTQDIGTGTYTIIAQVAADALGISPGRIKVEIGDSSLPQAPVSGGSMTAASVTPAVQAAATKVRDQLIAIAIADTASPLHGMAGSDVETADGWLQSMSDAKKREPFAAVLARAGGKPIEANGDAKLSDDVKKQYAMHSFGAVFVEVEVDEPLAQIRVRRIVATYGTGRILNAKTARSQFMGGIVWGVGMALMEHTMVDERSGRVVNANLAQYHVPVNADIGEIDVTFVDENDRVFNPVGAKGIGEIGITGVAAAIANAVFHATGKRVRDLPITPDALLNA